MFQRITVWAACGLLAVILVTSVGCGPGGSGLTGTSTPTAGSSGSIRGFQFVEIGKTYAFMPQAGVGTVKKDLGGGWVAVEENGTTSFVNLNAVSCVDPRK